jgi:hypothetical protein
MSRGNEFKRIYCRREVWNDILYCSVSSDKETLRIDTSDSNLFVIGTKLREGFNYKGKKYPIIHRELLLDGKKGIDTYRHVATDKLGDKLGDPDDYGDKEETIDEDIYMYASDEEYLSRNEDAIMENIGEDVYDTNIVTAEFDETYFKIGDRDIFKDNGQVSLSPDDNKHTIILLRPNSLAFRDMFLRR